MVKLVLLKKLNLPFIGLQAQAKSGNDIIKHYLKICFVLDIFVLFFGASASLRRKLSYTILGEEGVSCTQSFLSTVNIKDIPTLSPFTTISGQKNVQNNCINDAKKI